VEALGGACDKPGWRVHSWVRMRKAHELLIETPEANLFAGMKCFQGTRAQRQPKASKHATRPRAPTSPSHVQTAGFGPLREEKEMNAHQFLGVTLLLLAVREKGRQLRGVAASGHRDHLLENVKTSEKSFTDKL